MHTQSFFHYFICMSVFPVCMSVLCVYTVWIEAKITRGISWN